MLNVLRSQKGGYDKSETLTKIGEYSMLLVEIQQGLSKDEVFEKMKMIKAKPISRVKEGFLSKQGFSIEDVDNHLSELENQIIDAMK